MARFCFGLCLKLFLFVSVVDSEETVLDKRILLSDPSYIQTLEAKLQELTQKVSELTNKLSTQESENTAQSATISELTNKLSTQESENSAQGATISELTNKLSTQELKNAAQNTTVTNLEKQVAALVASVNGKSDSGGTFVRWGRTTCPHNVSERVYNGYAGGSWFDHTGGAAEYICMPSDPEQEVSAGTSSYAFVYGVEYDKLIQGHLDDDAPCAVCRTTTTYSVLMIPGRTTCYPGWTPLYSGILASGYYGSKASSQYVCVDSQFEFVPHSSSNENGKFLEPVASKCGSLACPPYINDVKLSCAVCTK